MDSNFALMPTPFTPETLFDGLTLFNGGMNAGVHPLLLPKNQLAYAENITVRGDLATDRPPTRKLALTGSFSVGKFQGGCAYVDDSGNAGLALLVEGRLFAAAIAGNAATITEHTVAGQPAGPDQAWLWQSEHWVIVNDGVSYPLFFNINNLTAVRSVANTWTTLATVAAPGATIPPVGGVVDVPTVVSPYAGAMYIYVVVHNATRTVDKGVFQVQPGGDMFLMNVRSTPGTTLVAGDLIEIPNQYQLPPGRMGAYVQGRNWIALPDGKTFMGGDIVGSSSGTQAENYRDAVLSQNHNALLVAGGNFVIPGQSGDITAFSFAVTLDAPLGQGPLQVFTDSNVFSCLAPTDDTTWQSLTTPILPVGLTGGGCTGAWAVDDVNGDLLFRSPDGIRSVSIGRRDSGTWGNAPISREIDPQIISDDRTLLNYTSKLCFDNRSLCVLNPVRIAGVGTVFNKIAVINLIPASSLRGKQPAVYDGIWTVGNVLQLFKVKVEGQLRAFAVTWNTTSSQFEIIELLLSGSYVAPSTSPLDNGTDRIVKTFEFPVLDFGQKDPRVRDYKELVDGEIGCKDMAGIVDFQTWFRADFDPVWHPWYSWSVDTSAEGSYNPRMGLGQPDTDASVQTDRPWRQGWAFFVKLQITGPATFTNARFQAVTKPQPAFAGPKP